MKEKTFGEQAAEKMPWLSADQFRKTILIIDTLHAQQPCGGCEKLREALREISEGKGPFSTDHITHASNTIEAMKSLALNALAQPCQQPGSEEWKHHPETDTRLLENITVANGAILLTLQEAVAAHNASLLRQSEEEVFCENCGCSVHRYKGAPVEAK